MYDDFFTQAHRLESEGRPFATATVVRVERPTSGKPGDRAIVTPEGDLYGWVGGSCTRPTVVEQAKAALSDGRGRLVRLAQAPDESRREGMTDLAMTCFSGGTLEIYIEPHPPRPRLVIVGHEALARTLAALGKALGYRVVGVETGAGPLPEAVETLPGVEALSAESHPLTFIVVATHGEHDEVAVEKALLGPAPYVGLVASRKRGGSIVEYLRHQGVGEEALRRLHSPAGLDLGAQRPDEIALSILAEIVQVRRGLEGMVWEGPEVREVEPETAAPPAAAIDPVCGMSVQIAGAKHVLEHAGTTYYFCCGGCRATFAKDPAAHLGREAAPRA